MEAICWILCSAWGRGGGGEEGTPAKRWWKSLQETGLLWVRARKYDPREETREEETPAGCGTRAATDPGEKTAAGARQEIPASPSSSADAAVATTALPTLHPPDANLPQRGGPAVWQRGRGGGFLVLASPPAPLPAAAATQAPATSRGAVAAPAAEQSRSGATATRGKIGRTRPLTGETASADPTAPPLTRALPAGRGAAGEISGEDLLVALRAAGLNLRRISARDGGLDNFLHRGEVNGAHLPIEEMAAVRHVLQRETLTAALALRAAPTRVLGRLCAGSGPSPPWRRRARLTWARPTGPCPPPTDSTVPDFVYFDSSDE